MSPQEVGLLRQGATMRGRTLQRPPNPVAEGQATPARQRQLQWGDPPPGHLRISPTACRTRQRYDKHGLQIAFLFH